MAKPKPKKARPLVVQNPAPLIQVQSSRILAMAERAVLRHASHSRMVLTWANRLRLRTEDDLAAAAEDRAKLKRVIKGIESARRLYSAPLDKLLKAVNAFFRGVREPFDRADAIVNRKVLAFRDLQRRRAVLEQERLQREAQERARREHENWERNRRKKQALLDKETAPAHTPQDPAQSAPLAPAAEAAAAAPSEPTLPPAPETPPPPPPVPVVPQPPKSVGPMTFPNLWDVEVLDLAQLPVHFLLPNMARLREEVRERGVRRIPGCRIFQRETTATRTN